MLKILYFGKLSDVAGRREEQLDLPDKVTKLSELKDWLTASHDLGNALNETSIKITVNQQLILEDLTLNGDEEIGFLPPVGGG